MAQWTYGTSAMLELRCDGPLCGFLWQISCLHGSTWTNTPATTHRGRVAIHAHTYEIARLCAFDYRSTTSLSSIIEAPPPFMIFQPFQRDDVSLIEGLRRLISLYYTGFGGAESIVGVIVATRKAESPGNLATLESLVSMYKGMLTSLNLLRFLYSQ